MTGDKVRTSAKWREGFGNTSSVPSSSMESTKSWAAEPVAERDKDTSGVRSVLLADLSTDYSPRQTKLDHSHVAALMEVVDRLPPITVHQQTMTVIDGVHRVEAHRRAGRIHIPAFFFAGTELDALVMAVEANVKHGKPLSRRERRTAAQALLGSCPGRSDRWVADICGLSHTTVAVLRARLNDTSAQVRTGRDGRRRPVNPLPGRVAVANAIAANPGATVRQVARTAGVAPSTVGRVAADLRRLDNLKPVPAAGVARPAPDGEEMPTIDLTAGPSNGPFEGSDDAASWLARTEVSLEDLRDHLGALPLSRLYEIADECRRRARAWDEIAGALERRARGPRL